MRSLPGPLWVLLALLAGPVTLAQEQHDLAPGLNGSAFIGSLLHDYKPGSVSSSAASKDRLYAVVDSTALGAQPGARCLYTGAFVPFDGAPNDDPSQDVYNNNARPLCLSQEHLWPRSMGTGRGLADRDLHHLAPSRCDVNSARSNLPFGESPDAQTSRWYGGEATQDAVPTGAIDSWSERLESSLFEPREDAKGNIARALFYVRTMYGPEGEGPTHQLDLAWFEAQVETLYRWHYADPVDAAEYDRTLAVAPFQDGMPNPFVLDSTAIRRAFFPDVVVTSTETSTPHQPTLSASSVFPNPSAGAVALDVESMHGGIAEVVDLLGRGVRRLNVTPGAQRLTVDGLAPGTYVVRLRSGKNWAVRRFVVLR
ncbi:MAG: endonuclease [Bacteroidota bacterium]